MRNPRGSAAVRLGILENRLALRESLVWALERSAFSVVSQTSDPEAFLRAIRRTRPAVVIIEMYVRGNETPRLIEEALRIQPDLKMIVVTSGAAGKLRQQCMEAGAFSCVDRLTCPFELVGLVQAVSSARTQAPRFTYSSAEASSPKPNLADLLSRRQIEVLQYIAVGADNLKIAAHLAISERTVKSHVHAIYQRLGIENRTQLALYALRHGVTAPAQSV